MAAEGIGVDGLHCISGMCDLCGETCDANTQELNVLSCTFMKCEDLPYHQDCLEKYLKSIRLERNRKTGFKCPRGCGKGTKHPGPCPGKIDKSHPIHPRNEEQKKKKKAALPQVMAVAPARVIKTKEEKKAEKEKAKAAAAAATAAAEKQKASKPAAPPRPAPLAPTAAASTSKAKQQQQPDARKLAETAAALKREIAANKTNKQLEQAQQQQRDASPSQPEYKTLDAYLRENSASSSSSGALAIQPVANAWGKPPTPAAHALSGVQHQQRHRPAEPSRLQAATTARDLSPVSPAAAAVAAAPAAARASAAAAAAAAAVRPAPAAVAAPPLPPPPPPTPSPAAAAAAAGQQLHPGLHHVPSIHSHPLATQGSTASLASQSSAGASGAQLPVGAEYIGDEGQLTKAQRKNLKRAEKKKAKEGVPGSGLAAAPAAPGAAAGASGSQGVKLSRLSVVTGGVGGGAGAATPAGAMLSRRASSNLDSLMAAAAAAGPSSSAAGGSGGAAVDPQDEESVAVMHELAVHALLAKKTLALVASLQRLGFTEWQAAAAVQRHGSELEDAVAWLLEGGAPDPDAAAAVSTGCVADVSIVEELRLMEALGAALPQLPRSQLYVAVADAGGDLDKAAAAAMAQHAEIVAAAAEAAAEAQAAAAAAAVAAAAAAAAATPMGSSSSPLASVSVTASPTSTTSTQQQHVQAEQVHEQQQQALSYKQQEQQQQQQQQLPNGLGTVPEAAPYSAFGDGGSLSLYAGMPSALALEAVADAGMSPLASPAGFGSYFATSSSTGLGSGLSAHPLHSLASTSSLGVGALDSAGSGVFGGHMPGSAMSATAAAAMASNIWGAGADAASSSASWGQLASVSSAQQLQQPGELLSAGAGSGSLFAQSGLDSGLGGWGTSGLGLLGNQGGMATAAPAANPYAPFGGGGGGLFGAGTLGTAPYQQPAVSTPAAGDAGLQQSRLFSSYGVSQPPLYGTTGAATQGQQQQGGWALAGGPGGAAGAAAETAASADTDDDLEGMLATLMCH